MILVSLFKIAFVVTFAASVFVGLIIVIYRLMGIIDDQHETVAQAEINIAEAERIVAEMTALLDAARLSRDQAISTVQRFSTADGYDHLAQYRRPDAPRVFVGPSTTIYLT